MTENDTSFDFAASMSHYEADRAAFKAEASRLRLQNKAALFTVLKSHNITQIVVSFDGYGDSGQMEDVEATSNDKIVSLPHDKVTLSFARHGGEAEIRTESLREAIESMTYDCLEETHWVGKTTMGPLANSSSGSARRRSRSITTRVTPPPSLTSTSSEEADHGTSLPPFLVSGEEMGRHCR